MTRMIWQPRAFCRFERPLGTSTGVALIVTDAGKAYIKALGNAEGPHALACDWVGTHLARLLELPTAECAVMRVGPDDEIPLGQGRRALPGPAFVSRALPGYTWGGGERGLKRVENVEAISRLVVFDTWVLNVDRCAPQGLGWRPNPDNVFLTTEGASPGRVRLIALDHTRCFGGHSELTERVAHIGSVRDERVYGLFPAFSEWVDADEIHSATQRLGELDRGRVARILATIPQEWEVRTGVRAAILEFLCGRARYIAENVDRLRWPGLLPGIGPV